MLDGELWCLGFDPGRTGAAMALAPDGQPTVLWTWRPRQVRGAPVYEVCVIQPPHERVVVAATLHEVGVLIRDGMARVTGAARWRLAVEVPHVARNVRTALGLAVTIGKLIGPMEEQTGKPIDVRPAEWRSALLKLPPGSPRDRCKRVSLREMPRRLPPVAAMLAAAARMQRVPLDKLDHVTDAAGVTEYGRRPGKQDHHEDDDREAQRPRRRAKGVRPVAGVPAGP